MKTLKRWMTPLLLLMILSMTLMPALAQGETTQEPQPTTAAATETVAIAVAQPAAPTTTSTIPTDAPTSPIDDILLIIGSIGLVLVLGGAFYLALEGLNAAKIMVPQETVTKITESVVNVMKETMATVEKKADETISPMDNAAVAVAKIPVEWLIKELTSRSMTAEQRSAAIGAIAQSLELDLGTGDSTPNPLAEL